MLFISQTIGIYLWVTEIDTVPALWCSKNLQNTITCLSYHESIMLNKNTEKKSARSCEANNCWVLLSFGVICYMTKTTTRAPIHPFHKCLWFSVVSCMLGTVVHIFNSSTWETWSRGSLWVWNQPDLHSELQDSLGYIVKACIKPTKKDI